MADLPAPLARELVSAAKAVATQVATLMNMMGQSPRTNPDWVKLMNAINAAEGTPAPLYTVTGNVELADAYEKAKHSRH